MKLRRTAWIGLASLASAAIVSAHDTSGFSVSVLVNGSPVPEYASRGRDLHRGPEGQGIHDPALRIRPRAASPSPSRSTGATSSTRAGRPRAKPRNGSWGRARPSTSPAGRSRERPRGSSSSPRRRAPMRSGSATRRTSDTIEAVFFREKARQPEISRKDETRPGGGARSRQRGRLPSEPGSECSGEDGAADSFAATGIGDRTPLLRAVGGVRRGPDAGRPRRDPLRVPAGAREARRAVPVRETVWPPARSARGFEHDYAPDPYAQR